MFLDPSVRWPSSGDFAVCSVGGDVGLADVVGEALDLDPFRAARDWLLRRDLTEPLPPWRYGHAFVYVGGKTIVQAEPGGAQKITSPNDTDWKFGHKYVLWSTGLFTVSQVQRDAISDAARQCATKRIPYSIADYLALTTHRLHIPAPGLQDFIEDSGHMICSQLVDWCCQQGNVKLFDDDRWNGYVTPADLAELLVTSAVTAKLQPQPRWLNTPKPKPPPRRPLGDFA